MDWKMTYTSYTRCTDKIIYENNQEIMLQDIPKILHDISHGLFELHWGKYLETGVHLKVELLDTEEQFREISNIMRSDKDLKLFLVYHMRNTIYDWNFNSCAYCGEVATMTCTSCWKQRYCSKECQRKNWNNHKLQCKSC